jgi:hypothetical protein
MGYRVGYDKAGTFFPLRRGDLPAGSNTAAGTWHNMIVVLRGNQIAYFVDGVLAAALTDNNFTHGGFDMYAGWGTAVRIDNLRLWDVSDLPPTE